MKMYTQHLTKSPLCKKKKKKLGKKRVLKTHHSRDKIFCLITGGGAIKVYVYFIRRELLLKWPKNEKWKKKKNHCYFGVSSSRNLAKTPPLAFLGQSQPVVGSMWKNEQFFGDLNFHKSEPHQHQSCKN